MRKIMLAGACALAFSVSGCANGSMTLFGQTVTVADVQAAAVKACSFLPTAETVTQILAAGNGVASTASQIANVVCDAINGTSTSTTASMAAKLHATVPTVVVNGKSIVIHGTHE